MMRTADFNVRSIIRSTGRTVSSFEGRATRGMDRFAIQKQDGQLIVDVDKMFKQDEDSAAWTAAVVTLT